MQAITDTPEIKVEMADQGASWVWVVSQCGWPPLSGEAPSHASAQRIAAFASSALGAFARVGRRRF